jgi:hypothetical protein
MTEMEMNIVFELPASRKVWLRGMKGSQPQAYAFLQSVFRSFRNRFEEEQWTAKSLMLSCSECIAASLGEGSFAQGLALSQRQHWACSVSVKSTRPKRVGVGSRASRVSPGSPRPADAIPWWYCRGRQLQERASRIRLPVAVGRSARAERALSTVSARCAARR